MVSCAFVARTTHDEPASPGVNVEPETVHVPDTTCHVTAPVPEPPDDVSARFEPNVADVEVTDKEDCEIRLIVRVPLVRVSE